MNWKKTLIAAAAAVLLFGGGYYTGRTSKPVEERREQTTEYHKTEEKQAEKKAEATEKTDIKVEDKTKVRKKVRIVKEKKPDGSSTTTTDIDYGKDNDVKVDVQYVTSVVVREKEVVRTEVKWQEKKVYVAANQPAFTGGIHAGYDALDLQSIYPKAGVHGAYRVFGPVHVTGDLTMRTDKLEKPEVFVGISWEFF